MRALNARHTRHAAALLLVALAALLLGPHAAARGGDDVPAWLRQAAAATLPGYDKDVPAVVLWDESRVSVDENGRIVMTNYHAVKILTREGRALARAVEGYETDSGKVREMRAWLIRPSGEVKKYGKDETMDVADVDNDVYNEARSKIISAKDDAEAGAIFGYEATSEYHSMFNQLVWGFQERLPVVLSRLTVMVPSGWRADGTTFNHATVEPTVNNTTYAWELRNLPPIEPEVMSPPVTSLAPWLAVTYQPAAASGKPGASRTFGSWSEVSRWMTELSDPQMVLDDSLAGKAKQLTANAKTEFERIQAIGRFAQAINYVSIQIGIGRLRPHAATEVFAKSYGDCKDKANLMRAMLKAVGLQAHLLLIYSGDPTHVREEWPSPSQFNHCIIAIKVSDETQAPTVIKHPTLGRLLIFDPTDDNTPVGDLPGHEQGSFALLIAGEAGALMKMPVTPPEANRLEREADVTLAADGTITASVRERSVGQAAVAERSGFRGLSRPDYLKVIERWIAHGATGAAVSKVEPADNPLEGKFALQVEFTAPRYAQLMQDRLLVFKPAIISRRETLALTGGARKQPVVLRSNAYAESVRVKLPAGFEVDEMPDPVKMDAPFGSYETVYQVKDGQLVFTRKLVVRAATIPVEEYAKVRGFFERIRAAEAAPVVLAKK
ncbi:MAG TPA: DUF3857 domain-containing protein [Blastocatellia bacterium]|nr:DUF3857 domain-containing protein [Blastocatellia bacterium]